MGYVPDFSLQVRDYLESLDIEAAEHLLDQIDLLLEHPTMLSRPARNTDVGQCYITKASRLNLAQKHIIIFRYYDDEQTLEIVSADPYARSDPT